MIIRTAETDDADAVAALQVASWRDAYAAILDPAYLAEPVAAEKRALWRERLASPRPGLGTFVAVHEAGLAGFVCVILRHDARWGALVDNLHAAPDRRGLGVGTALLRAAAAWVSREDPDSGLSLTVFEANARARRFYARRGGRAAGTLTSHISAAGDAPVERIHWPSPRDVA